MKSKNKIEKLERDLQANEAYKPMIFVTHSPGEDYFYGEKKESFATKEALLAKYPEDQFQLIIIQYVERGANGQESK